MNRLILNPKICKFITDSYPVLKKRPPHWFFKEEIKKNAVNVDAKNGGKVGGPMKHKEVLSLWNSMEPEQKRKYFNLAEFDDSRHKHQKLLWIAEVGALLKKYGEKIIEHPELLPNTDRYKADYEVVSDKLQKKYDNMILSECTKTLYKDAADRVSELKTNETSDHLLSSVPDDLRHLLKMPRRPDSAYKLFTRDKVETIKEFARKERPDHSFMHTASYLWKRLSEEERKVYYDRYKVDAERYKRELVEFEANLNEKDAHLHDQAMREKRAFTRSLRRKLRDTQVVPLNVRNPFNFYAQDNKETNLTELTTIWNNLPEEEKSVYKKKTEEDAIRYHSEQKEYQEFLNEVLRHLSRRRK